MKTEHLAPIAFIHLKTSLGRKSRPILLKCLLDSGASSSLVHSKFVANLRLKNDATTKWLTSAGEFVTKKQVDAHYMLTEFHEARVIQSRLHVIEGPSSRYDMILGRDVLKELGIDIKFSTETIEWDGVSIPMKSMDAEAETDFTIQDSTAVQDATSRIKQILEAKYEAADLRKITSECTHLDKQEQEKLLELLEKYKSLFDGTLGEWKGEKYHIELKENAKPFHARAYPIPKTYEETLKLEVDRLCQLGVLKKVNRSEWASPTFIIPKKDGTVRFISDFRELNKLIKRKPFPLPKIQDLLLKLEGFQYGTSLDLNMGYYHINLDSDSSKYCTIVLPWGKYEYSRLPMGLCNSPDIFQEKMGTLMADLEFVRCYIDDILCITKGNWDDHLEKLEQVFQRLQAAGLKINANKSSFGQHALEYLGYWITRTGIMPIAKKVQAIQNIQPPKTKKELRSFIGMINYYRDMWPKRSETLASLAALCGKHTKWQWTEEHQRDFDAMKKLLSRETLLAYPDFNQPFIIHTDASKTQLGAVISQNGRPIAFYSRKLNPAQRNYTTTERELLAIVETLKEFRNILLGQTIHVYTDHQNLTYKNFNTERVMRWRLILEEYGPTFYYIKGPKNVVADALSRLDIGANIDENKMSPQLLAEVYGLDENDLPCDAYPLDHKLILRKQQKDKELLELAKNNAEYRIQEFNAAGKRRPLICKDNKIVIPSTLQQRIVEWYHVQLCHPGQTRTEATINQHFTWKGLRKQVQAVCSTCHTCQMTKVSAKKYGHLPEKEAEAQPWERLCVDLIGPYMVKESKKTRQQALKLWCLTMIDPATGWFEMRTIKNKEAATIANLVEQTWLTRYPWPSIITYDKGTEFMAEFAELVQTDYGITRKGATTRNPQANAIIERIHQTLGNILRTFEVHSSDMDPEDSWEGILAAVMFALRATYHTTLQATPSQLVFGRDAITNIKFEADWNHIRQLKQQQIKKNNQRENAKRIAHQYKPGDKVLFAEV